MSLHEPSADFDPLQALEIAAQQHERTRNDLNFALQVGREAVKVESQLEYQNNGLYGFSLPYLNHTELTHHRLTLLGGVVDGFVRYVFAHSKVAAVSAVEPHPAQTDEVFDLAYQPTAERFVFLPDKSSFTAPGVHDGITSPRAEQLRTYLTDTRSRLYRLTQPS